MTLWGTWCPPCISEIPVLKKLQADYADRGLVVVAIAFERYDDVRKRRAHLRDGYRKKWEKKLRREIEALLGAAE